MTILFIVECVAKVTVEGFAFNGDSSYIKSNWNKIDFLIILVTSVTWIPYLNEIDSSIFKLIRMLRILRPLRMIQRF
jgi:hypothetical protein